MEQIVSPHVRNEHDIRVQLGDVREILIRPYPNVGAAVELEAVQPTNHVQIASLIRDQVVRVEVPTRLGDPLDERREVCIGDRFLGDELRRPARCCGPITTGFWDSSLR